MVKVRSIIPIVFLQERKFQPEYKSRSYLKNSRNLSECQTTAKLIRHEFTEHQALFPAEKHNMMIQ